MSGKEKPEENVACSFCGKLTEDIEVMMRAEATSLFTMNAATLRACNRKQKKRQNSDMILEWQKSLTQNSDFGRLHIAD